MTDIVKQLRKHHVDIGLTDNVESWLTAAADEIERLREALRKISNMGQTNVPDHWDFRVKAREIARAALGEKE